MKNEIETQRQLIDQLYWIVKGSCPDGVSSAKCRFEYDHGYKDGSSSVGSAFSYIKGNEEHFPALNRDIRRPVKDLVPQLHSLMKVHTGGDWNAFTLIINEDGSVTTKFEYPDEG
ncbi:hypothetical protein [Pseudovibrio sp. POLY-S9]|uniref:hypothetical protein n=1 Tax=Pseudovibrio sp. POLY-S9 TaxID=1576596 RepID=UPI00070B79BE|nr:hypothetical protein [Pseudovibrio sp. POLY-S9]